LAVWRTFLQQLDDGQPPCWRSLKERAIPSAPSCASSKHIIVETPEPIPAKPGRKARHDYEYVRNGVANLFTMSAPLEGWRRVKVTDSQAAIACATYP
jgi:hypothetical protein